MTKTRVLAALVMGPAAIAAVLLLPTPWMMLLAALVFLGGLWEWFRLAGVEDTLPRTFLIAANLLLMVTIAWASRGAQGGSMALFHVGMLVGVAFWWLAVLWLRYPSFSLEDNARNRATKLVAGTLAVVPAWCALVVIHGDPNGADPTRLIPRNHLWLLAALMIVWMADTGAYFAGRKFGRRKLAPDTSPNKTVEGLLGGLLAAVLVGLAFGALAGAGLGQLPWVALAALSTAIASVIGDLFESLLKRQAGVKDSSDLIPGHGGILDRVDSVLAALPVFALCKASFGF
ncbi:phosphatidate cytidylyltransferase [Lysobacter pythonis]|uniref:Phosphatidate cytidylyltransferase n=1 Tax=Solilutibacter pythonis TaxID=2483112 RepID=A0A3M2HTI7_9GAMM|nr:phosphatidate cytidylyltransferase [Lysobacter pythonis]RMH91133.1 phosphatidate cytidylyltransferase [Lysobacter pythonis]